MNYEKGKKFAGILGLNHRFAVMYRDFVDKVVPPFAKRTAFRAPFNLSL